LPVKPTTPGGLHFVRRPMVDRLITVPKSKVGARVGQLDDRDLQRLNQAVLVLLGLAAAPRIRREA
jgi:mRNA interferase MazF